MNQAYLDGGRSNGADRISELPDEIIHVILDRLKNPRHRAKSSLLSRRWMQIWLSYPILQFHCDADYHYSAKLQSFVAAAAARKRIKSLRISSRCSDFIRHVLDLIVDREPEEIVVKGHWNLSYQLFPTQLINNPKLRILDLLGCKFWEYQDTNHLDMRMINLRVLRLERFSIDERVLNHLIAGSPLLEELKLSYPRATTIGRLHICNNPNLKILQLEHCRLWELIQIRGTTKSLETMSIQRSSISIDLDNSPSQLSSLKSVKIYFPYKFTTGELVNNMIANSPCLQSLSLYQIGKQEEEVKIRSDTLRKLDLGVEGYHQMRLLINAPRLVNVNYSGFILPAITHPAAHLQEAQPCTFTVSLCLEGRIVIDHFIKLKDFLAKLRHQFQFVRLIFWESNSSYEGAFDWEQVEDGSSIPMIQHVEFEFDLIRLHDKYSLMSSLFSSCHPKYLCLIHENIEYSSLKYMAEIFMNRNNNNCCRSGRKCWHQQLKDVKIVSGKEDEGDERLSEISNYVDWPYTDEGIVWLKLIWH